MAGLGAAGGWGGSAVALAAAEEAAAGVGLRRAREKEAEATEREVAGGKEEEGTEEVRAKEVPSPEMAESWLSAP